MGLADRVEHTGAPLPRAETAESAAFLRWIGADNFVLLGMRDYDFAGGGEAQPPLGVLREPGYRAFGGLRDLASLPPEVRDFLRRRELLIIGKTDQRSTVHRSAPMDAIGVRRFDERGEVSGLRLFVGLFTSSVTITALRAACRLCDAKVEHVLAQQLLSRPPAMLTARRFSTPSRRFRAT